MRKRSMRMVVWLNGRGRMKLVLAAAFVTLAAVLFTYELPATKTWTYWKLPLSGKVIAVDAGHGGPDGGAVSSEGVVEKEINLAIAQYLRDYLQEAGALVVMTRETDADLARPETKGLSRRKTEDLLKRVEFINKKNSDLLISIHMNSIPSSRWSGAQTFYYDKHPDNQVLATLIQEEIRNNLKNTTRLANTVNTVYLLKASTIPSALVEVGFLSNPAEARMLANASYQKKIAAAIYRGILRYCSGEKLGSP